MREPERVKGLDEVCSTFRDRCGPVSFHVGHEDMPTTSDMNLSVVTSSPFAKSD